MQTCPTCGASLAADLEWCNQCYAPLQPAVAPTEAPAPGERPLWVRSNIGPPPLEQTHEFSRWRAGATSFGPIGRAVLTALVLVMLAVGYPLMRGLIMMVGGMDVPGAGFMIMYLVVALPLGIYLLSRVWRRERIA
jgi:hypothetical protein